ncbi:MAG: GlsB/YeaQ/YmgE family stress response membrane protein [Herpetosiphon sp.]
MGIISWLIFGGLAGWVAGLIMHDREGVLMNIIVGIVGAFIGGFLWSLLGGKADYTHFNVPAFIVAVVGAIVLLGLINYFRRGSVR